MTAPKRAEKGSSILLVVVRAWLTSHAFFFDLISAAVARDRCPRMSGNQSPILSCVLVLAFVISAAFRQPLEQKFLRLDVPRPSYTNFVMKTFSAKQETIKRDWYVIDATGKVLGRVASEVARRLRGKHKPEYTPHVDTGDYIIIVNADKLQVTGKKTQDKIYHRYTGYQSGLKATSFRDMMKRAPRFAIEAAVRGMLPKNPLGRQMFRKLKVYRGTDHRHAAQQPKVLEL